MLRHGVPDGLLKTLIEVVARSFYIHDDMMGRYYPNTEAINEFARISDRYLPAHPNEAAELFQADRAFLLDAVDFGLGQYEAGSYEGERAVEELNTHLAEARSAYTVGVDGNGRYELQDRQPEAVTALIEEASSATDRSAEHLRRASSKAFARKPDPTGACVEAVAAIEVAAKPVVSPNNAKATLGTIIRDMKAKPSKWTTDSEADGGIETVIAMMDMVWTGHFRHGDENKPVDVSNEGAEMVVQLAAVLVHWFRSGRIRESV